MTKKKRRSCLNLISLYSLDVSSLSALPGPLWASRALQVPATWRGTGSKVCLVRCLFDSCFIQGGGVSFSIIKMHVVSLPSNPNFCWLLKPCFFLSLSSTLKKSPPFFQVLSSWEQVTGWSSGCRWRGGKATINLKTGWPEGARWARPRWRWGLGR